MIDIFDGVRYLNKIFVVLERLVWSLFKLKKKISQIEDSDIQGTPEEDRAIQQPKRCVLTHHNEDEYNSQKNHDQNSPLSLVKNP